MKKIIVGFALSILAAKMGFATVTCVGVGGQSNVASVGDSACNFAQTTGAYADLFTASVSLNDTLAGTTTIQSPLFKAPDLTRLKGMTPLAGMEMIHVNVAPGKDTLGKAGTQTFYTVHIVRPLGFSLTNPTQHLFILPDSATPNGLLTYVAGWDSVNPTTINVHLDRKGSLDLVFGTLADSAQMGVAASPDTFTFANPLPTNLLLSAYGFKTVNPLILVTPVLAGGTASKSVISSSYPVKTLVITAGLRSLGTTLRAARFFLYYKRAAIADAVDTGFSRAEKKPFSLNSVGDSAAFTADVSLPSLDDSASLSGVVSLPSLAENITAAQWGNLGSPSQISRGLEVIVTVFDGGVLHRSRVYIPAAFREIDLESGDQQVDFEGGRWNLYSYPWDEASGGAIGRVIGDNSLTSVTSDYKVLRYTGAATNGGYVNLTPGDFSDSIDLGHAFWSGRIASGSVQPVTAGGVSQDVRTFSFALAANKWNDFGTPFNFPIRLKDILDSSAGVDTSFHVWPFNAGVGNSVAGSWGKNAKPLNWLLDTLYPWKGYTVYAKSAATLRFPVRDVTRSTALDSIPPVIAKAAAGGTVWGAQLQVLDKTAAVGLTVGKGSSGYAIEEAPSVPGQDFHAVFAVGGRRWSSIQESAAQGLEGHWPLQVTQEPGFTGVDLRVVDRQGTSEPLALVETVEGTSVSLGDSAVHLTAQALAKGDYHIVAGGPDYAQSFLQGVTAKNQLKLTNFPNPFADAGTSIQFSLPTTFSEVAYQARIYDFQGRVVWEKNWNGGSQLETFWDGHDRAGKPAPAGEYRLLVTAQAPGKTAFRAQSSLIKIQ